ncbi:unnamed protein product [Phaeothamnion confervicola]
MSLRCGNEVCDTPLVCKIEEFHGILSGVNSTRRHVQRKRRTVFLPKPLSYDSCTAMPDKSIVRKYMLRAARIARCAMISCCVSPSRPTRGPKS